MGIPYTQCFIFVFVTIIFLDGLYVLAAIIECVCNVCMFHCLFENKEFEFEKKKTF